MKLPDKNDPDANIEGGLFREIVIQVLIENAVSVKESSNNLFILQKNEILEAQVLEEYVGRLMVKRLSKLFDIEFLHFYYDPNNGLQSRKKKLLN